MKTTMIGLVIASAALTMFSEATAQNPASGTRPSPPIAEGSSSAKGSRDSDEKAIREVDDAFVNAYNVHEAKAIARLFIPDAELVDEDGDAKQGRAAIESVFAAVFKGDPEVRMSVTIQAIRFLTASMAVEEGVATVVHRPHEEGEKNRYVVVHVKQDGQWRMASARDLPDESPSAAEPLKQLDWLIGDWVDESPDSLVATSTRWTDNHCYILSQFVIQIAGRPVMNGSQRIGWDPLAKIIRCWVFDSEGGFATGVYSQEGNRWIVKLNGVTRDGKTVTATNITTRVNKDRITWQSRDRVIGGRAVGDIDPVTIVRKPPQARLGS